MAKNLKMRVHGDVQGVGFRDAARWAAEKFSVTGFAMNVPDGVVYIEAEGEETALKGFLAWCKKGPATARVSSIETEWSAAHGKFTGFRIG
jgi:acylphosphatase